MNEMIVVGVDGHEPAARAADRAAFLAQQLGASLHAVCAYSDDGASELRRGADVWHVSGIAAAEALAESAASRLAVHVPHVTSSAVKGRPADALIAEATRLNATMIVVGNRRVQGISRVLGSVAGGVAHHAPCDVCIVHTVG